MKGGILPQRYTAGMIMNESTWWIFDGMTAVVLIIFAVITAKRGLIKGVVSMVGFALSVLLAITVSGSISGSMYKSVVRTSSIKELNKIIDENTLSDKLAFELENMGYNMSVDSYKLKGILENSKSYDADIYKFMNNINGKKVDDEEPFMENLHIAYSNVVKSIMKKDIDMYHYENAAQMVLDDPTRFTNGIPLFLAKEDLRPAATYLCDTFLETSYNSSFRLLALVALLAVFIVLSLIFAQAAGRNDKMEPGIARHLFCGLMGLVKGAAVVFAIAVILRISVIYGNDRELMINYPAIDRTYVFKYVYDFVCGLK